MSKHRLHEDDETTLLPRAVEDPAAVEPAARGSERQPADEPARRRIGRQPLVIGVATMCLLVSGAAAWALAKPAPQPSLTLPSGGPSKSGAGFTDGFGVMTPSAAPPPEVAPARPSASASASPVASPAPGSSGPRPSRPPAVAPPAAGAASATYDVNAWGGGYVIAVRVRNAGSTPLAWKVRIQLPAGSTVDGDWEADRSGQDGVWVFTPERGDLAPGASVTFGFLGRRGEADFKVTCTVDGVPCQAD
ncbi:cellulose binding domain-containing protein [Catellatospora sichuanensis]|uniref:cellulose binding domain-containing protein n=1 Tax=Catellatospora sichuanensis TaxID=1969805 RepID=UPI001182F599|nr:cellulose binding domain-containing protein [Catellatospora sichuanensis]